MPTSNYVPDGKAVLEILEEQKEFVTSDIRMALAAKGDRSPTKPVNRMLNDLKDEGYLEALEYDVEYNHKWRVETVDPAGILECLGEYSFSELSPDTFYDR